MGIMLLRSRLDECAFGGAGACDTCYFHCMRDKGARARENFGQISIALIVILVAVALWKISRSATTLASAGFSLESEQAWSFLIFCLGVAGLTMSLVQVCRMLYPFRGYFHRKALERWLSPTRYFSFDEMTRVAKEIDEAKNETADERAKREERAAYLKAKLKTESDWKKLLETLGLKEASIGEALREFEQRRGTEFEEIDEMAFYPASMDLYDLPIEQLSGQLNLALEAGLDEPMRFRNLIVLMAGKEGATDLLNAVQPLKKTAAVGQVATTLGQPKAETEDSEKALVQAQSRAAITRIVQLRIDSFQISAGGRWRHRLRLVVLAVSFFLSFIVLFNSASDALIVKLASTPIQTAYSLVVGAIGGYLAMFLRDLTVIVENKRRRV